MRLFYRSGIGLSLVLGLLLVMLIVAILAVTTSFASGVSYALDQSQQVFSAQLPDSVFSGAMEAQTFVPGTIGSLGRVFVYASGDGTSSMNVAIETTTVTSSIFGTFATPTGTVLASTTVTPAATPGWVEADFSTPASVTAGITYAIVLSTSGSQFFNIYGSSNTSSYTNGEALHYGGGAWYPPGAGYDLAFKTYMELAAKADTSVSLTSSANPSILQQPITLTATVSAVASGAGTPTGSVTFLDGAGALGTSSLVGGVATFTTPTLSVGSHTIKAVYSGDSNFNGSNDTLSQQVSYAFSGFLQPIPQPVSTFKGGSTIPVKFVLTDYNGNVISDAVANVSVNGGPSLGTVRFDSTDGQYVFNLRTKGLPLGSLVITVSLNDSTTHSVTVQLK